MIGGGVGVAAARCGGVHVRPLRDAEQVNHARCAWGSKVVSYQHAQRTPVVWSTADAGTNCCVALLSAGLTWARNSGFSSGLSAAANTSGDWFAPTSP